MQILLTGGTGFLGRALCRRLLQRGYALTVLSRHPERVAEKCGAAVQAWSSLSQWIPDIRFDAVVNLSGAPILDWPWTNTRRQVIRDSRIGVTKTLVQAMALAETKPTVLLSGSAIGIYGDAGDADCTESHPAAGDFAARLCADWESAAREAAPLGVRVCLLRTGLVLHPEGGMLKKLLLPFRLGLGSRLGDGRQYMSWIHRGDYLDALEFLLDQAGCEDAFNLTAPAPVTNSEFTQSLARSLHRPAFLVAPRFALRPVLGQRTGLLTTGQKVLPEKLQQHGFAFKFPRLDDALADLLAEREKGARLD